MLPEEDRATAIGNMHKTFGEDRTFNSEDMSHISRTDRRAHHNTPFPCRGGVIMDRWAHASLPVQAASRILDRFIRFATSRQTDTVHTLTQTTIRQDICSNRQHLAVVLRRAQRANLAHCSKLCAQPRHNVRRHSTPAEKHYISRDFQRDFLRCILLLEMWLSTFHHPVKAHVSPGASYIQGGPKKRDHRLV